MVCVCTCPTCHIPQSQCHLPAEPLWEEYWVIPCEILVTHLCRCHLDFEHCPRRSCCRRWTCSHPSFYNFKWILFTDQEDYSNKALSKDLDLMIIYLFAFLHRLIIPSSLWFTFKTGVYFSSLEEDTSCKWLRGLDPEIRQNGLKCFSQVFLNFTNLTWNTIVVYNRSSG